MSGFYLKLIAIFVMLVDHIGVVYLDPNSMEYIAFRGIGRLAFPIFAYFIAEGCSKTGNIRKYLIRLFIFALISEIPFDLAFDNSFLSLNHQNIFFTLFLGALSIYIFNLTYIKEGILKYTAYMVPFVLMFVAEGLRTDYGAVGVFLIFFIYLKRERFINKAMIIILGNIMLTNPRYPLQLLGILSLIPLYLYNCERGRSMKYVFYMFYPVHLLILGMLK